MKVTLIAATQPLIPGITSIDDLLAYAARVSNPSNQMNTETAPRLLGYCIKHGHWSVFETASFTVEIETSLAIAMQILRHRSFTFQMFSQRYAEVSKLATYAEEVKVIDPAIDHALKQVKLGDMIEPTEMRMKAEGGNRQGSGAVINPAWLAAGKDMTITDCLRNYAEQVQHGVAPESARFVLPQCTKTRLYMTGNIRSWIHYLQQRTDPHAQKEHRAVALEVMRIFADLCPLTYRACVMTELPARFVLPPQPEDSNA